MALPPEIHTDIAIIGAGAAGMMAAAIAGQRGRSVWLADHRKSPGEKIRISGGGRCNFTNIYTSPENFLSSNPHFCKSTLACAWLLHQADHVLPIPGTRSVDHFKELVKAAEVALTPSDLAEIDAILPLGWAFGDRYSTSQWNGVERYC